MYCPQCGHQNAAGAKFCIKDGTPLVQAGTAPASAGADGAQRRFRRLAPAVRPWQVLVAVILLSALGASLFAYRAYLSAREERERIAYARGTQAYAARNYEQALADFQAANDHADARNRLVDAERELGKAVPLYTQAAAAESEGRMWDAAYGFRQALDLHPAFRDADQRLAQVRAQLGRLLYASMSGTGNSQRSAIWSAMADGSDRRELFSREESSLPAIWSIGDGRLAVFAGGQTDTLYLMDRDGTNRREVLASDDVRVVRVSEETGPLIVWARQGPTCTVFAIDPAGGGRRELFSATCADQLAWHGSSQDGSRVLLSRAVYHPEGEPPREARSSSLPSAAPDLVSRLGRRLDAGVGASPAPAATAAPAATPTPARGVVAPARSPTPTPTPVPRTFSRQRELILIETPTGGRTTLAWVDDAPAILTGSRLSSSTIDADLSPDGRAIFYTVALRSTGGRSRVHAFLQRVADGERIDLGEAESVSGSFSGDSRLLGLTVMPVGGGRWTFTIVDAQTGGRADFLQADFIDSWVHSARGGKVFVAVKEIGASTREVLYRFEENGSNQTELLAGSSVGLGSLLSSEDRYLHAVASQKDRSLPRSMLFSVDGSSQRELAAGEGLALLAEISPDDSRAAVVVHDGSRSTAERERLLVYDLRSSAPPVQVAAAGLIYTLNWSPDGRKIAYCAGTATIQDLQSSGSSSIVPPLPLYVVDALGQEKPVRLVDGTLFPLDWTRQAGS